MVVDGDGGEDQQAWEEQLHQGGGASPGEPVAAPVPV